MPAEHPEGRPRIPWQVADNRAAVERGEAVGPTFHVERTDYRGFERAATCWDFGLACLIEAALNLRDGTVE